MMMNVLKRYYLQMIGEFEDSVMPSEEAMKSEEYLEFRESKAKYAYQRLKNATGQDFGDDFEAWEKYLRENTNAFKFP
jgi:hypothetical protein